MDFAGEDKVADTDVDMDAGAEGRPQNIDEPRPHPPPLHHFLLPPVPPPVSFEPPASLPSLPCGSSFTHDDSVPQTDPFEIFEDPGPESSMFMEIDLPCFVDPSWYITPDDNKENTNEDVQQHDSQVTEYRSEQDYHLTYAELGLHEPILALENPHHRHATTLAEVTIASEGAGIEEHQHPLPSPTTLSATEVSLRALPSQTAATDGSLNPASNLRSVPRRILRLT
ncbi:hypothetical protein BJY04DRAFT_5935 [Aspergillus karnatakaensis]|uniref:uncharacterized protein n=1 Tax=Aspergillus karnatakaensis TaxID=1810916 RepID=UPI003CCDB234